MINTMFFSFGHDEGRLRDGDGLREVVPVVVELEVAVPRLMPASR